jgi:hypothetical protein
MAIAILLWLIRLFGWRVCFLLTQLFNLCSIPMQFAGSGAVVPWMISEALRKAIGKR